MLQEIIDLQDEAVSKLLEYALKQKESTFKAPNRKRQDLYDE